MYKLIPIANPAAKSMSRRHTLFNIGCLAMMGVSLTTILVMSIFYAPAAKSVKADASMACLMAQDFVKRELKAPASAKFPGIHPPDCVVTQRGRIWVVRSYVDAENSFGAHLRNDYGVELIHRPATGQWERVSILVVPR